MLQDGTGGEVQTSQYMHHMYFKGVQIFLKYLDWGVQISWGSKYSATVSLAPEKQEGLSTELTFLGITINATKQILILPSEKLSCLMKTLDHWIQRKTCTRRELESLIGILQHACTVIQRGRTFMRNAIPLLNVAKPHSPKQRIQIRSILVKDFCFTLEQVGHNNSFLKPRNYSDI